MAVRVFPPGTILQYLYIKKRLAKLSPKRKTFLEFGSGNGSLSNIFLKMGYRGFGFDLNPDSCLKNEAYNSSYIKELKYVVLNQDMLNIDFENAGFDVIISSMVIEHLDENTVNIYFEKCKSLMNPGGVIITLVPSSMKYWGIEDEIAGHYKRYTFEDFEIIARNHSLKIKNIAGLTYPLSNILFPISNHLIKKQESKKLSMTMQEQTVLSGNRNVKMKTSFPPVFGLLLNNITMYPLHLLQMMFKKSNKAMVIYCEMGK